MDMPRSLLLAGATGQIGRSLLPRLLAAGWQVHALSRRPVDADGMLPCVHWVTGDLTDARLVPPAVQVVVSAGPLDHFAHWYRHSGCDAPRIIAFGSTSEQTKQASEDPHERALVARLQQAGQWLLADGRARGAGVTLLRPTLVWGAGMDRSLTPMAALARRWGHLALPADACGLRQPVHVDDLADAVMALLDCPVSHGRTYDLAGGEVLSYDRMVARVLAASGVRSRLWKLPAGLFGVGVGMARHAGWLQGLTPAVLARMRQDLVFDNRPAAMDFGYAPRPFRPTASALGLDQ